MHYAGENFILIYILPTHEKLKTHFGFSQAKCIKKVQAKVAKKAIWSTGVFQLVSGVIEFLILTE